MDSLVVPELPVWAWVLVGGAASLAAMLLYCCGPACLSRGPGMGSGENSNWNRYIDQNPPRHKSKQVQMKWQWEFIGQGGSPGLPESPGQDKLTGYPLTGHLIGRHVWASKGKVRGSRRGGADDSFNPAENPNSGDKIFRAQQLQGSGLDVTAEERGDEGMVSVDESVRSGLNFYSHLLCDDGHFAGDYGGPFFLMPGLIMTCHMTGADLGDDRKDAMLAYLRNHQQEDGGWGLHIEGPSTMFGTVMNYVATRCLGASADAPESIAAQRWIKAHGGAGGIPSWGKFWLCTFGVYEWEGLNSIPPELWLLPDWFPFHPRRMWCHARMVYLPMSYIYGARARAEVGDLQLELRQEIYCDDTPYDSINWNAQRNNVCPIDLYSPHTKLMDFANEVLSYYEAAPSMWVLRKKACDFAASYCAQEDLQTNYVDIGPVNKVMNMLVAFHVHGGDSEQFRMHEARIADYLWVAEDGMKMQGYNGSQLWDTAFFVQAAAATGMSHEIAPTMARIHDYVDATQIKVDEVDAATWYRIISKGGWPFSTNDHGWPIADCTSEGLKAALLLAKLKHTDTPIPPQRLFYAVNVILNYQNADGGWATYERNRGWDWFEWLNPAEVFGDIMIDYTYTELTSACVTGLRMFQDMYPAHRTSEVSRAIRTGTEFVVKQQRSDGSFYGSWAVCFTYGCWFGVEAMLAGGMVQGSEPFRRVCDFLISKQNEDGGWGESYLSCVRKEYANRDSTVVNTAWALLAMMEAGCRDVGAVERGIAFLVQRQRVTGDWPQESVAGIFNRTCGITYTAYRNVFPLWALGVYRTKYSARSTDTDEVLLLK